MDEQAKALVQENNREVYQLGASMTILNAVQSAVAKLMCDVDEGIYKSYYENPVIAKSFINEIEKKLRLIDMAFYHLNIEMQSEVKKIENTSNELSEIVVKMD